jgi:primosomal replication protein N
VNKAGKLVRLALPNGQYQLQLWIEKTRTATDATVQTETWTSAPFTITGAEAD